MADEQTPLERLDDAIQAFLTETDDGEGRFMTGWALGISTARIQSDDTDALPMVTGMYYTLGPQTSIVQLAGLAKFLDVVAENAMYGTLNTRDADI